MTCLLNRVVVPLLMVVLLSSCSLGNVFRDEAPMVTTSLGAIQGSRMESFRGKTIYAFRGIPYAQPPLNELRFDAPKPVQSWAPNVLKATSDSLICPQTGIALLMSEDCLKLNVFTKNITASQPVIVYIHGGANVLGSGHSLYEAGPQYLLEYDVVLVAFNYRLGALGFLSGGNFGYLDQVLALDWVQTHIHNFGGDPDSVTLLGMSAGSMAVSLHLASPLSTGLFHRAILMSGSATNHFSIHNEFWTRLLARQLACPMYNLFDLTECLRNVTWQRIVEVCNTWEQFKFVNMKWNYGIDNFFMPKHPTELIDKGKFNRVPLLVTFTANELDYTTLGHLENDLLLHDINENFDDYAPELFLFDYNVTKSKRIKELYFGKTLYELNDTNIERFGEIFSDAIIGHGVHRLVDLARKYTNVYYARMDYAGKRSLSAPLTEQKVAKGVGHADDLQYIMPGLWYGTLMSKDHSDLFMVKRMTQWFTHFARTGQPMTESQTGTGQPMTESQNWPPCNATKKQQLYNNKVTTLGPPAYAQRYELWDKLFPKPTGNGANKVAQRPLQVVVVVVFGVALAGLICKLM